MPSHRAIVTPWKSASGRIAMPRIRILIADDHPGVRAGLRALLEAQPDIEVVGEAADGVDAVEACRQLSPDVVLMDLTMPRMSGLSATAEIHQVCPYTKVLALTMHEEVAYVREALLAGAGGYALKKSPAKELIDAIRAVHGGRRYITPSLARELAAAERRSLAREQKPLPRA